MPDELQTLKRGLETLAFMRAEGKTNLAGIARHMGLPRQNVGRLVQTLVAEGYCMRLPNTHLYVVTPLTARLASGRPGGGGGGDAADQSLLIAVASPVVERLAQTLDWPIGIAAARGLEVEVLLATDTTSPLALLKARPGLRSPMLMTTTGLLYLASLAPPALAALVRALDAAGQRERFYANDAQLLRDLDTVRSAGYALRDTQFAEGSLGLPIHHDGVYVGALTMRYIRAGLSRTDLLDRYRPRLAEAAERITAMMAHADRWMRDPVGSPPWLEPA